MKKVLVIAYLYPPIFNSGTRRSLEFVNHLPDHGWTPTVLTVDSPDPQHCDPSLLDEVRPGTRIERAPLWTRHMAPKIAAKFASLVDPQRLAGAMEWRVRRLWNVPDECASWIPLAVEHAVRLHAQEPFDAIYATGWPWSSFLIAEKVSRRTGVPFVVDYRDLWKPAEVEWDKTSWLQRRLNPGLERRVLRAASGVIATTESFLGLLPRELLPKNRFFITNGFNEADFPAAAPAPASARVRIVYTGVWRPGYGPDDLYAAVRLLKQRGTPHLARLQIVVAGYAPGPAREYGIDDIVEERGRVQHADATALMSGASVLYLPVSKGVYEHASMPGKLFEYLGSARPILASAQAVSEVAKTLTQVGGARRADPGDVEGLADILATLCQSGPGAIFSERIPSELAMYTRASLTGKLALALDAIVQHPRSAA
ncbi:glycosyltransferase [Massilia violaceinigra]|uniref:Glycosyltransferase n=1 Tax=Massilia violaceinigra TaxID=2045208 RepID=A0ABY4AC31_9BURK|nr:glycosyltransferase [Massilia violaceinigra]UOD32365.1 glycosyltransferase [Massilia violaceinigra]